MKGERSNFRLKFASFCARQSDPKPRVVSSRFAGFVELICTLPELHQAFVQIRSQPAHFQRNSLRGNVLRRFSTVIVAFCLALMASGCATTRRHASQKPLCADATCFELVGIIDFRCHTEADYLAMVQPGDLVVNYMRAGRAVKEDQWLYAVLPYGHAMIIVDPHDFEHGILEGRFRGVRCVGIKELKRTSYNLIYRLRDNHRLNYCRLQEATDYTCSHCKKYSFESWLAINSNMQPDCPQDFSSRYTCSTFVAAMYHYCGVTLDVSSKDHQVVTPLSIAASWGVFNQHAGPSDFHSRTNQTTPMKTHPNGDPRPTFIPSSGPAKPAGK